MKIVWTQTAQETFNEELDFIYRKWNQTEVEKFLTLIDEFLSILKTGIIQGKVTARKAIMTFVISQQTTLVYTISKDKKQLILHLFWNNKRNPKDFEKFIKNT